MWSALLSQQSMFSGNPNFFLTINLMTLFPSDPCLYLTAGILSKPNTSIDNRWRIFIQSCHIWLWLLSGFNALNDRTYRISITLYVLKFWHNQTLKTLVYLHRTIGPSRVYNSNNNFIAIWKNATFPQKSSWRNRSFPFIRYAHWRM